MVNGIIVKMKGLYIYMNKEELPGNRPENKEETILT